MQHVADIFAIWPVDADLAREIGMPYPTVSSWKQRGSIPVAHWRSIIRAARKRGHPEITADLLVELHAGATGNDTGGFAESETTYEIPSGTGEGDGEAKRVTGHFSRHKDVRRNRFKSADEIEDHIRALREEWSHR